MKIQDFIDQEAEKELQADIIHYLASFKNSTMWNAIEDIQIVIEGDRTIPMYDYFFPSKTSQGYKKIFNHLLPSYIERKSREFYNSVKKMEQNSPGLFESTE